MTDSGGSALWPKQSKVSPKQALRKEIEKAIDTCLHPERNGLLIKEGIAEGATHEHIIKRELKKLFNQYLTQFTAEVEEELKNKKIKPADWDWENGFNEALDDCRQALTAVLERWRSENTH